jgi:hypothetical protein
MVILEAMRKDKTGLKINGQWYDATAEAIEQARALRFPVEIVAKWDETTDPDAKHTVVGIEAKPDKLGPALRALEQAVKDTRPPMERVKEAAAIQRKQDPYDGPSYLACLKAAAIAMQYQQPSPKTLSNYAEELFVEYKRRFGGA